MAVGRMLKESIRTSKTVNSLSDFQFRVWAYLITYVDDFGRGSADPELLKGLVFPRRKGVTEAQIANALTALANAGMIALYESDGESYLYFPKWEEHQRIRNRTSKFPTPTDCGELQQVAASCGELPLEVEVEREVEVEGEREVEESIYRTAERPTKTKFTPPTVEEVASYCRERQNDVNPQRFVDHYTSVGWKVGKNPMKDWKAAVRTWERSQEERNGSKKRVTTFMDL